MLALFLRFSSTIKRKFEFTMRFLFIWAELTFCRSASKKRRASSAASEDDFFASAAALQIVPSNWVTCPITRSAIVHFYNVTADPREELKVDRLRWKKLSCMIVSVSVSVSLFLQTHFSKTVPFAYHLTCSRAIAYAFALVRLRMSISGPHLGMGEPAC